MKKKLIAFILCIIILGIDFYLLPFLIKDTGTAMLLMLCVMPLVALASSVAYGIYRGFSITPAIAALVLFIPTIFIHYNSSAWIYAVVYALIALAGIGIGRVFYKKR